MKKFDLGNGHEITIEPANRGLSDDYKITFYEDGRKLGEDFYTAGALEFEFGLFGVKVG